MRKKTQIAIDALHAQIAALVAAEKAHHDSCHPGEVSFMRSMAHTRIECAARSPEDRQLAGRYAVLPPLPEFAT